MNAPDLNKAPAQGAGQPDTRKIDREKALKIFTEMHANPSLQAEHKPRLEWLLANDAAAVRGLPDAKLQEHIDVLKPVLAKLQQAPVPEAWELQQQPTPDLSEARRLMDAGFKLVPLMHNSKAPVGMGWNQAENCLRTIPDDLTGVGMPLAINGLCSVDPDDVELATIGLAALGFNLDEIMAAGARTVSTRPRSGGRSAFKAPQGDDLHWLRFCLNGRDVALELRAHSTNLQDTIPGLVYQKDGTGDFFTQRYAEGSPRLDAAPELPPAFLEFWKKCSEDHEFFLDAQKTFAKACGLEPVLSHCTGKNLPFTNDIPQGLRNEINAVMQPPTFIEFLCKHGYTKHGKDRLKAPRGTGAPGIRLIGKKTDLWQSDHASDPLMGTFDPCAAIVILAFDGDAEAFVTANRKFAATVDFDPEVAPVLDPKDAPTDWIERANEVEAPRQKVDPQRLKKALAVHVDGHIAFPDPFPGHMASIVEEALRLAPAPQPELTMMGAVIGMCASVGSHYCLPNGQRTAMQGVISAKSTAGKEWAVVVAEAIARAAGATIAGRPASGPALEDSISETPVLICNNEFAKTLFQAKGNSSSPLAGVVEILLKIFTGAGGSYSIRGRSKIKGAEEQAQRTYHHPNLCTIGLGTPEGFAQCLDTTAISDGYLGRVLFVASNTLPPVRRQKGKFLLPSGVTAFLDLSQLIDPMRAPAVQAAPNDPGNIIVATYADESEMDALIGRCNAAASRAEGDTAILIRRNYEKAERICLMLAVWDNPKAPVVTKAHILWAEQLINASNAALLHFVGNQMFDEVAQRDGALILGSMKMILRGERKPYKPQHLVEGDQARVSRSFLIAVTKLEANRFNKGMDNLLMRGEVSISGLDTGTMFSGQTKRYQWVTLEC